MAFTAHKVLPFFLILVLISGFTSSSSAEENHTSAYGPEGKRFGLGPYLGEPLGLTLKGYPMRKFALDGVVGWSFVEKAVTLMANATYEFVEIPTHSSKLSIPFYAGGGIKIGFGERGRHDGDTFVALRFPLGLAFQLNQHPVEFFFEIAPGVQFAPNTDFDLTGGVGARFYF